MRRALAIVFFLGLIACAVLFAVRHGQRAERARPQPAVPPAPPASPSLASPRLAVLPAPDAAPAMMVDDESALMRQIRALIKREPAKAEALAREARRRFPDGAEADERDALLVDALVNQQRIGAARDETYYYFDHHPGGRFGEHLFVMTGVRPPAKRP
jgi:hypothetical protein